MSPQPTKNLNPKEGMTNEQSQQNIIIYIIHRFTKPSGKYHWTGHRNCNVALSAKDAIKFANICPVCRKRLTKGVEQRVEELADRPNDYKPNSTIGCMHLLPLSEIIAAVQGSDSPSTQKIWSLYNSLIQKFGNEYTVLIDAPKEAISTIGDECIAETILRVRQRTAEIIPGYDGVYGKLIVPSQLTQSKTVPRRVQQLNLTDFAS